MEKKLLIAASIILNLGLTIHILYNNFSIWSPTWTNRAAAEAEAAASVSCSGHGRAYLDGIGVLDGHKPPCQCNNCYTGKDCSILLQDCLVDAESGDPLFLEPFWIGKAEESAVVESGWHRMSYEFEELDSFDSAELDRIIKKLHNVVGNAVTDDRFIIFGTGATQLIAASVHALSLTNSSSSSPSRLLSSVPYYNVYQQQAEFFRSAHLKFEGDAHVWKQRNDNITQVIEIVTSPNNPDGKAKRAVLDGPNVKTIHDYAYYWPYFTPITHQVDEDLSLFSLSKTTGHACSRFGWALVKDKAVYQRMKTYITLSSMGVSRDTQLRVLQLLKVVIGEGGDKIFNFGNGTLKKRWEIVNKILSTSTRFSLQTIKPDKVKDFTPGKFLLMQDSVCVGEVCERLEDTNCYEIFKAAKITGRNAKEFGSEERFVRLSLIKSQDDFDQLSNMLKKLVSQEPVGAESI